MKFSPNGSKLLTIGEDVNYSFALYDWMSNQIIASSTVCRSQVTDCDFKNECEFAICSVDCIKFWSVNGYNCICSNGISNKIDLYSSIIFAFTTKKCVLGPVQGKILKCEDHSISEVK